MWSENDTQVLIKIFETAWACLCAPFKVMNIEVNLITLFLTSAVLWLVLHLIFEFANPGDPRHTDKEEPQKERKGKKKDD